MKNFLTCLVFGMSLVSKSQAVTIAPFCYTEGTFEASGAKFSWGFPESFEILKDQEIALESTLEWGRPYATGVIFELLSEVENEVILKLTPVGSDATPSDIKQISLKKNASAEVVKLMTIKYGMSSYYWQDAWCQLII